jgi:hypothetical protein
MREEFLIDPKRLTVTVKDGVVTVAGTPGSTVVGHEIVRGSGTFRAVAVRDRLSYPPAG